MYNYRLNVNACRRGIITRNCTVVVVVVGTPITGTVVPFLVVLVSEAVLLMDGPVGSIITSG